MEDKRRLAPLIFAAVTAFGAVGCGDDPYCDAEELTDALADAEAGETVEVGACTIEGTFTVPADVELKGAGASASRIVSTTGVVLRLDAGAAASDVSIESGGEAGIIIIGGSEARVERVEVIATKGLGVGVSGATNLTLRDLSVRGPITPDTVDQMPTDPTPAVVATRGLVVSGVANAALERVQVTGFAQAGVLLSQSSTHWSEGGALENVGVGLMVVGGQVELADVELSRTFQGMGLMPAYAGVFADGASVQSTSLVVRDNEALGLLHAGAGGSHVSLVATGNGDAALRLQSVQGFSLEGTGTELADNRVAALVIIDSSDVDIADARIANTQLAKAAVGSMGTPDIGDGIQLLGSTGVSLRALQLESNGRVGILFGDADAESLGATFDDVSVDGSGAQLGAIAQGAAGVLVPGSGWDVGIERLGATADNDVAMTTPLEELGVVGPEYVPAPDVTLP